MLRFSLGFRWGKLIYATDDVNFAWPGADASGQPLPEGVYTYVINAVEWDNAKIKKAGSITILR